MKRFGPIVPEEHRAASRLQAVGDNGSTRSTNPKTGGEDNYPVHKAGQIEIAGHHYVTPQRLSDLLGVTVRTLARWTARGIGPPRIAIGKTVLIDLEKVPAWLADRESEPVRNARY
jgi:hypothetical protein